LGQRRGLKNPWAGEEDMFLVHPQKGLNGLMLNWWLLVNSSPKVLNRSEESALPQKRTVKFCNLKNPGKVERFS
jgi:hypothetical protein